MLNNCFTVTEPSNFFFQVIVAKMNLLCPPSRIANFSIIFYQNLNPCPMVECNSSKNRKRKSEIVYLAKRLHHYAAEAINIAFIEELLLFSCKQLLTLVSCAPNPPREAVEVMQIPNPLKAAKVVIISNSFLATFVCFFICAVLFALDSQFLKSSICWAIGSLPWFP